MFRQGGLSPNMPLISPVFYQLPFVRMVSQHRGLSSGFSRVVSRRVVSYQGRLSGIKVFSHQRGL